MVMECTCNPLANLPMVMAFPLFCSIELADFPCNAFSAISNQKYLPAKQLTQHRCMMQELNEGQCTTHCVNLQFLTHPDS